MNFLNHNQSKNHPAPVLFPKDTWKHKSRVVAIPLIALLIVGGIAWYGVRERGNANDEKGILFALRSFEQGTTKARINLPPWHRSVIRSQPSCVSYARW